MKAVRLVVIGAGRAGAVHAWNLRYRVPDASLEALVDPDLGKARDLAHKIGLPETRVFPSLKEALQGIEVDAVVITTPTFTHASIALEAFSHGLHVFCEKPLARNLAEGKAMVEAATKSKRILQVGFMRRFDPAYQEAKRLVEKGVIGRPLYLRSLTRCPGLLPRWAWNPEEGLGILGEVNSHDFDVLRFLGGAEISRVMAWVKALRRPDLLEQEKAFYDTVTVLVELDNGAMGVIEGFCPAGYGYDTRAEVVGEEGVLLVGDLERLPLIQIRSQEGRGWGRWEVHPSWSERFEKAYLAEISHFVEAIRYETQVQVRGEDGLQVLKAVLAAYRSLREGRFVTLAEVEG